MGATISAGGAVLPSPVELSVSGEIIWSANTGRTASGRMVGDVIAEKETLDIQWGILTASELSLIRSKLTSGFFPVTVTVDGTATTLTYYRGSLTATILGTYGGVTYYRDVSVTIIEQ